jgi:hypothetical protein
MSEKDHLMQETIVWKDACEELPDDGIEVLVTCGSPSYPVWIGVHDGDDGWRDPEGLPIAYVIYYWADMPSGPK